MKTILITGATDGLGKAVALELAKQGHTLLLHGRNAHKGEALIAEIAGVTGNKDLTWYKADFAAIDEIKKLADTLLLEHKNLDVLINNAGLGVEPKRRTSEDGLEIIFQVDYLATYILSKKLFPLLKAASPARVVNVASAGQAPIDFNDPLLETDWDGVQSYCQAKLAQIMLGFELADAYHKYGVTVNSLHPASYMPTKIVKGLFSVQSSIEDGVASVVRLAVNDDLEGTTGKYFNQQKEAKAHTQAYDAHARKQLLQLSAELTGVQ